MPKAVLTTKVDPSYDDLPEGPKESRIVNYT